MFYIANFLGPLDIGVHEMQLYTDKEKQSFYKGAPPPPLKKCNFFLN